VLLGDGTVVRPGQPETQVRQREELVDREPRRSVRMARPYGAHPRVLEQRHRGQIRLDFHRQNREVDVAVCETLAHRGLEREESRRDARRKRGQKLEQRPQHQEHDVIARGNAKRPLRGVCCERPLQVEQVLDLLDAGMHGSCELLRACGELQIATDSHE
jgi:hypothetical protein